MKKYSPNFERDWEFYTNNIDLFSFWGGDQIFEPTYSPDGINAKEYFYKLDSLGIDKMKHMSCNDPQLVSNILRFKKALNFNIKQWCEGYDDCGMGVQDYLTIFNNPPEWVIKSFRNQLYKNK